MIALDTNMLVRALVLDNPAQVEVVRQLNGLHRTQRPSTPPSPELVASLMNWLTCPW